MKTGWERTSIGAVLRLEYGKPLDEKDRKSNGRFPIYGANGEKGRTDKLQEVRILRGITAGTRPAAEPDGANVVNIANTARLCTRARGRTKPLGLEVGLGLRLGLVSDRFVLLVLLFQPRYPRPTCASAAVAGPSCSGSSSRSILSNANAAGDCASFPS